MSTQASGQPPRRLKVSDHTISGDAALGTMTREQYLRTRDRACVHVVTRSSEARG